MSEDHRGTLSSQEIGQRFDLLAAESKEYAVFLVEPGGSFLCWNPGAERLFGYRADEIIGQHFSRFFSPEDVPNGQPQQAQLQKWLERVMRTNTFDPARGTITVDPVRARAFEV